MFRKYPSVFLLAGVIVGILLADSTRLSSWIFLLLCVVCGVLSFFAMTSRRTGIQALLIFGTVLFFAALRFGLGYYALSPNHVSVFADGHRSFRIFGVVSDWPDMKPDLTEIKLSVDSLGGRSIVHAVGSVLIKITDTTTSIQRGDYLECYARIYPVREKESSAGSDYQRYLRLKGISGVVYLPTLLDVRIDRRNRYGFFAFVDWLRESIRASFYRNLTPQAAALASGFLIGETRDIPVSLYQHFRDSGTLHLLAVSGSNVALVVLFFVAVLRPFNLRRKTRAAVLLVVVIVFNFLSYGEPSVLRASLMAVLVIGAGMLERRYDLNNIIALAALIILLAEPSQMFDIGFQLSFTIAWGLIFILPRLTGLFEKYRNRMWYRFILFPLLVSLVAQLCATGLIGLYFQRIPILSPVANLAVVPMVSVAVIGVLILLAANLVLPILGLLVGSWLDSLMSIIVKLVDFFGAASMPALSTPNVSAAYIIATYCLIAIIAAAITNRTMRRLSAIASILVINLLLIKSVVADFAGEQHTNLTCLAIPGGLASLVWPEGSSKADLIVLGVKQTRYPLDEKVIAPLLKSLQITEVGRIFVLSGEYGALDDLIRVATEYGADTIYAAPGLVPSLREVILVGRDTIRSVPILAFSDHLADSSTAGYYTSSNSLLLKTPSAVTIFAASRDYPLSGVAGSKSRKTLVLGQTWNFSSGLLQEFEKTGISTVVCSQFEQPETDESGPGLHIHQVNVEGPFKLELAQ